MRDCPLSETNNRTGEDSRDNQIALHDAQTLTTESKERLLLSDGGGLHSQGSRAATDASIAEVQDKDEQGALSGVPVEVVSET